MKNTLSISATERCADVEQTSRAQVIAKLGEYFGRRLTLAGLVDWAERAMMAGEFDGDAALRDVVARLGVADVRDFGLTWADCEAMLDRLGYRAEIMLRSEN